MKEQKEICDECGKPMEECQCEKKGEPTEDIHDVQDINPENEFDYTEEDGDAIEFEVDDEEPPIEDAMDVVSDVFASESITDGAKKQLKESLMMFRRLKKFN